MEGVPNVRIREATYETVTAKCPYCGYLSTFNRRCDLTSRGPIGREEVACENDTCSRRFAIISDSVNSKWELFLFETYTLRARKRYSSSILVLAQAHEVFFNTYLEVVLAYRPFAADGAAKLEKLNAVLELLYNTVRTYAYDAMRNVFMQLAMRNTSVRTLAEARSQIATIPTLKRVPSNRDIRASAAPALRDLLLRLKESGMGRLRNQVVHKYVYRPSRVEVDAALEEASEILFGLAAQLNIMSDDVNAYIFGLEGGTGA